jgi:hypothetical protein
MVDKHGNTFVESYTGSANISVVNGGRCLVANPNGGYHLINGEVVSIGSVAKRDEGVYECIGSHFDVCTGIASKAIAKLERVKPIKSEDLQLSPFMDIIRK